MMVYKGDRRKIVGTCRIIEVRDYGKVEISKESEGKINEV